MYRFSNGRAAVSSPVHNHQFLSHDHHSAFRTEHRCKRSEGSLGHTEGGPLFFISSGESCSAYGYAMGLIRGFSGFIDSGSAVVFNLFFEICSGIPEYGLLGGGEKAREEGICIISFLLLISGWHV